MTALVKLSTQPAEILAEIARSKNVFPNQHAHLLAELVKSVIAEASTYVDAYMEHWITPSSKGIKAEAKKVELTEAIQTELGDNPNAQLFIGTIINACEELGKNIELSLAEGLNPISPTPERTHPEDHPLYHRIRRHRPTGEILATTATLTDSATPHDVVSFTASSSAQPQRFSLDVLLSIAEDRRQTPQARVNSLNTILTACEAGVITEAQLRDSDARALEILRDTLVSRVASGAAARR